MTAYTNRAGLQVAEALVRFAEEKALPGTGVEASRFWQGVADILARCALARPLARSLRCCC